MFQQESLLLQRTEDQNQYKLSRAYETVMEVFKVKVNQPFDVGGVRRDPSTQKYFPQRYLQNYQMQFLCEVYLIFFLFCHFPIKGPPQIRAKSFSTKFGTPRTPSSLAWDKLHPLRSGPMAASKCLLLRLTRMPLAFRL